MARKIDKKKAQALWDGVPPGIRERVRAAISGVERQRKAGVRLNGKLISVTVASVRPLSEANQVTVGDLLRIHKAGFAPSVKESGAWSGGLDGSVPDPEPEIQPSPVAQAGTEPSESPTIGRPRKGDTDLAIQIRQIDSKKDAVAALVEAAALASEGKLSTGQADATRKLLSEARQYLRDDRDDPVESTDKTLFLSPSAEQLVRLWEGLVSEERRARLMQMFCLEFEADLIEHPAVDTGQTGSGAA